MILIITIIVSYRKITVCYLQLGQYHSSSSGDFVTTTHFLDVIMISVGMELSRKNWPKMDWGAAKFDPCMPKLILQDALSVRALPDDAFIYIT